MPSIKANESVFLCLDWFMYMAVFPGIYIPMTSSLAFLCWVAPENYTANFIGSGLVEWGFNLSLDWSNITSSIMLYPYYASSTIRCVCSWGMDIDPSCQMGIFQVILTG